MVRPISASGLREVCPLCAHGRPMTYAWVCKMSAGPPMARPRSANELSVASLWSAQHPLVACARSAHDVPLANQRHAHGFANGRPMLCQVCMPVVSCQSASGLWLSSGRLTGQTYARAIGQTTVLADLGADHLTYIWPDRWTDRTLAEEWADAWAGPIIGRAFV